MAKILRLTDRIKLTIDKVIFTIAPLNHYQKIELANCSSMEGGDEHTQLLKAQAMYIKFAVKDLKGVQDYNGDDYELEFENDVLTDNCVSELLSLDQRNKLTTAAWQLLNGINAMVDPITGEKLKGVKLEVDSKRKK